jgi:hypothetical protein
VETLSGDLIKRYQSFLNVLLTKIGCVFSFFFSLKENEDPTKTVSIVLVEGLTIQIKAIR